MRHLLQLVGFVAVIGIGLSPTGCGAAPAAPPTRPTPVTVSYPIEREVTDYADFTGRTAAVDSVEVRARVGGYLERVNFKEGALVKKGDVLFEIDPDPYQAVVDNSVAQIAQNEAALKRARADNSRYKELARKSPEVVTQQDGSATLPVTPLASFPLRNGYAVQFFVRARKAGENLLAGVSARRLVQVRTAAPR